MIKRTPKYCLVQIDNTATGVFSSKFIRAKENEDYIFVSLPENFVINCREKTYTEGKGYQVTKEYDVKAKDIISIVRAYNKVCLAQQSDKLPF